MNDWNCWSSVATMDKAVMKKQWIAIVCSSSRYRNTDAMADYIIHALNKKSIEVKKILLDNQNISTCSGCEYCIETGVCRIKDNVSEIIDSLKTYDGLILASQTHNYNVSASMKAFIDRTFCLNDYSGDHWRSRLPQGKKAIIAAVCGGNSKDSMGYTVKAMIQPIEELGINVVDVFEYFNTKSSSVYEDKKLKSSVIERISANYDI